MADTVYRIQDENGIGPFKPGLSYLWVEERPDHKNLFPWYEEFGRIDKKVLVGCAMGSACRSPEQLKRWFTIAEYTKLKKLGYKCVKITVDRILAESEIQCFVSRSIPFKYHNTQIELYDEAINPTKEDK